MDSKALQAAIERVIDLLPPEIPLVLAQMVPQYWEPISRAAPELKSVMAPHIKAAMTERAMGVFDMNDVKEAIEGAFMAKIPVLADAMAKMQAQGDTSLFTRNTPVEIPPLSEE